MRYSRSLLIICMVWVCGSLFGLSNQERRETLASIVEKDLSLLPPNLLTWLNKQEICLDKYDKAVAKLNIQKLLNKVHAAAKLIKKPALDGHLPQHSWKNVHDGCAPYDETRTLRHIKGFYISASDVLTPEQTYIVSEAPTEALEDIFWEAIGLADVRTIVALVTPTDETYWSDNRFPRRVHGWKIEKISEKEVARSPLFLSHRIVERIFKMTNRDLNERRFVTHLHYENWPDHDAPEATLFHQFLRLIDEIHPESTQPILVHCAAGVGRSGTFVAAHSLRKDVLKLRPKNGPHYVNFARRILEMRMQRKGMLSRPIQVRAVVEAVRDAIHSDYREWLNSRY